MITIFDTMGFSHESEYIVDLLKYITCIIILSYYNHFLIFSKGYILLKFTNLILNVFFVVVVNIIKFESN